jgi:hypothetical protein
MPYCFSVLRNLISCQSPLPAVKAGFFKRCQGDLSNPIPLPAESILAGCPLRQGGISTYKPDCRYLLRCENGFLNTKNLMQTPIPPACHQGRVF